MLEHKFARMEVKMIKKADLEKAKQIYKYMEEDFPKNEIPNYTGFVKLTQENIQNVYIYEENSQEIAYFITMEKDEKVLITHLAVIKEHRGQGVGKRFIEAIKEFLANKKVLIVEVESEKNAKNEQELEVIEKRLRYYLNAGFVKCNTLKYVLYNVDYYILTYSTDESSIFPNVLKDTIESIYDGLFPKENLSINITI